MTNLEKDFTQLINQLEEQNKIAEQLNKKAAALEARKKVLEEQFLDSVRMMEKTLGKKIKKSTVKKTLECFMVEAEKVKLEVEKKILHQKQVIELIQNEKYDEAEALMKKQQGVSPEKSVKLTDEDHFEEVDDVVSSLGKKNKEEIALDLTTDEFELEEENSDLENENSIQELDLGETWEEIVDNKKEDDSFSLNEDDEDDFDFGDLVAGTRFSL